MPLARALVDAGLPVLEMTLRTECALAAIARIVAEVPSARIDAGTVLDARDLPAVEAADAAAISPGATESLYAAAQHAGLRNVVVHPPARRRPGRRTRPA